jgi:chromosome segregation ATPase
MLKNKGAEILVKYNGIEKLVAEGALLDVRDFDISLGQISSIKDLVPKVEKQILKKYPGQFDVVEHTDNPKIDAEYRKELDELKASCAQLTKALEAEKRVNDINARKIAAFAEEANGFGEKEASYKKQISSLRAELKDKEEEHDAHIKRITGGKK